MKRKQIIILHIIFWFLSLFTMGLQTIPLMGKTDVSTIVYDYLIYAASFLFVFYCFYIFISRKHLNRKNTILLILLGLIYTVIISLPITYLYLYFLSPEILALEGNDFRIAFSRQYMSFLETNFLLAVSGSLMKTALVHYESIMEQKETERQLILGNLALLKSQINPLFLFSSLENIRILIEKMPEKAIHSIENLSEIMSYMLYETSADKVTLENEIININNYLKLQEIRYRPDFIKFSVNGNTNGIFVPPLIFMPFVENAFKFIDSLSKIPGIDIRLTVKDNILFFSVSTFLMENVKPEDAIEDLNIVSIKQHLDLLYANNYKLETKKENKKHITHNLTINISPSKTDFK